MSGVLCPTSLRMCCAMCDAEMEEEEESCGALGQRVVLFALRRAEIGHGAMRCGHVTQHNTNVDVRTEIAYGASGGKGLPSHPAATPCP
eukprot:357167-Rhodomonas_salina.1